jgi:hypothetical protein
MKATRRSSESFWLTPKADQGLPADDQSRFKFRPLTQAERMNALDDFAVHIKRADGSMELKTRDYGQSRTIVRAHLIEVDNFPAGAPEPWPADEAARDAYLEQIDDMVLHELGQAVLDRGVMEPAAGN